MDNERRKIEFLTDAVSGFRGLPMMFFGLSMTVLMIVNYRSELNAQISGGKDLTLLLSLSLLFLIVYFSGYRKFRDYFNRKYGYARAKPQSLQSVMKSLVFSLPLFAAFLITDSVDSLYELPFNTTLFSLALFAFILWWANYRGISNNLLYFSAILSVGMFLPWEKVFLAITFKDDFWARTSFYRAIGSITTGITYFLVGLTDYQAVTSLLKPIDNEERII